MSGTAWRDAPGTGTFLSREECKALFDRVVAMGAGGGDTVVAVVSQWRGTSTWGRNRVYVSSETRQLDIQITRRIQGASSIALTTQMDDDSLRQAVAAAERSIQYANMDWGVVRRIPNDRPMAQPKLWSEKTATLTGAVRAELARQMIAPAEAAGMLSAGEVVTSAEGHAVLDSVGTFRYYPVTSVELSTNVRDAKRGASGWAGVTDYDFERVDSAAIAARALDKAQRSVNPVAIEPGRYAVILEPQAVADLFSFVVKSLDRQPAEQGMGPFANPREGVSKIGDLVIDRSLRVQADPMDPDGGFIPFESFTGEPYRAVAWMDHGILKELSYEKQYALQALALDQPLLNSNSYRLDAPGVPHVSVDEMIRGTQRGLLVTRFSNIQVVDPNSVLLTGFTRDGLWLIENGKISKPVKNFRFTESPLFILNNLEQVGTPVRVFDRDSAVVVPPVKVLDFSMTSLADAF